MFNQDMFNNALAEKYSIMRMGEAARANLANTQASVIPGEAAARNALTRAQASVIPGESAARQELLGAQTFQTTEAGRQIKPTSEAQQAESAARAGLYGSQADINLDDLAPISPAARTMGFNFLNQARNPLGVNAPSGSPASGGNSDNFYGSILTPAETGNTGAGYAAGTAKVPGQGSGMVDSVPAMLAPREAVLNEHGADIIGRDKIAAANAIGNHLAKQNAPQPQAGPQPQAQASKPAPGKGMTPGKAKPAQRPSQELSKGTHQVAHGKSARTPTKLDPAAVLALMGSMGGGQQPMAAPQPGGMV